MNTNKLTELGIHRILGNITKSATFDSGSKIILSRLFLRNNFLKAILECMVVAVDILDVKLFDITEEKKPEYLDAE